MAAVRYSAFISYNHRDRDWAVWLHRALERYRIPKRLIGRPSPWGALAERLPPVFRDRDELATSSDLAASVQAALAESATLVVVCSPNSAKSKWVDQEIQTFIAAGREQFIRLIIVDGEPHSPDPARECLPPSLIRDGAPEPLAADVRKQGDGKQGAKLKVLAGILGVPYDELRQREAARRQKRLAIIAVAASISFLVMAGLTVFAFISRGEAIEQRQLAERRAITAERTVAFVKSMFELADPEQASGASITAREIVDRGVARLDSPELNRARPLSQKRRAHPPHIFDPARRAGDARTAIECAGQVAVSAGRLCAGRADVPQGLDPGRDRQRFRPLGNPGRAWPIPVGPREI